MVLNEWWICLFLRPVNLKLVLLILCEVKLYNYLGWPWCSNSTCGFRSLFGNWTSNRESKGELSSFSERVHNTRTVSISSFVCYHYSQMSSKFANVPYSSGVLGINFVYLVHLKMGVTAPDRCYNFGSYIFNRIWCPNLMLIVVR